MFTDRYRDLQFADTTAVKKLELFDHQLPAKHNLVEWMKGTDPKIIHTLVALCGFGKTACTCSAIGDVIAEQRISVAKPKRIWVIVHRQELTDQWLNDFSRFATNVNVGRITDKVKEYRYQVVIVQVQTLRRYLEKIPQGYLPDILICDEAHETAFEKIINELKVLKPSIVQINLTGTPTRHGSSSVQYSDLFPKKYWFVPIDSAKLISLGKWKTPRWHLASEELAAKTKERFSGMKVNRAKGEYDETSQAAVMIDLLGDQLKEVLPKISNRSTVWFCVNTLHAKHVYSVLSKLGRSSAFVSGDEKQTATNYDLSKISDGSDRKKIVTALRQGEIQDYVTVQTATTGFDATIVSVGVFLRLTLSVGLFVQMAGRIERQHNGLPFADLYDLAGNLGKHPIPELIDWMDFNPSGESFRDPNMHLCKVCNRRHDSIPTPLHPIFENKPGYRYKISAATFEDSIKPKLDKTLVCHGCRLPVYYEYESLVRYTEWLNDTRSKIKNGGRPASFSGTDAGISIGRSLDGYEPLTAQIMYDIGLWKVSDRDTEKDLFKDKSDEFQLRYETAKIVVTTKDKISHFNEYQRSEVATKTESEIRSITDSEIRYKYALVYAYLKNYSPFWALLFWDKDVSEYPSTTLIESVIKNLCVNPEAKNLVVQWLTYHIQKYNNQGKTRPAKLIQSWINKYTR